MKKGCLVSLLILVFIIAGVIFITKTAKSVDVSWTEEDYSSYKQKVDARDEMPGRFNLISIYEKEFTSSGEKHVALSFTSEEVSSALSKENEKYGPIKNIKVKFLTNNEAETSFVLTNKIDDILKENNAASKLEVLSKGLSGTPVYMKVKVDKVSSDSIRADIVELDVGRISIPDGVENTIEKEAVNAVNKILQNYDGFKIEELTIDEGQLKFVGNVPEVLTSTQK